MPRKLPPEMLEMQHKVDEYARSYGLDMFDPSSFARAQRAGETSGFSPAFGRLPPSPAPI